MEQRLTALERAFQLARSGQVKNVATIRAVLKREGYDSHQVDGLSLHRQLRKLIEAGLAPQP